MGSNEFYEKLEDGFVTPASEVCAGSYEMPLPSATLNELLRDWRYTQRMAKEATSIENRQAWEEIKTQAFSRYTVAYGLPQHFAERQEIKELEAARCAYD